MENLIARSAYLFVCPNCRDHAQIVFSNGMATPHFTLKDDGFVFLKAASRDNLLFPEEFKAVKEQLENSPLPATGLSAEFLFCFCEKPEQQQAMKDLRQAIQPLGSTEETIH
jgi:hypothetical protein